MMAISVCTRPRLYPPPGRGNAELAETAEISRSKNPLRAPRSLRSLARRSNWLAEVDHRPDLDAPVLRGRDPRRDLNRVIQVARLDHVEAAELLLGFGERPVGRRQLAAADPEGGRRADRLQRLARHIVAALPDPLGEGVVLAGERLLFSLRASLRGRFVIVNQAQVPHGSPPAG